MSYKYYLGQYDHNILFEKNWMFSVHNNITNVQVETIYTVRENEEIITLGTNIEATYENSFKDISLQLVSQSTESTENSNNGYFDKNKSYYCKCAIRKIPQIEITEGDPIAKTQEFTIKLVQTRTNNDNTKNKHLLAQDSMQQYIKTVKIANPVVKTQEEANKKKNTWEIIDFVFTPQDGAFDAIMFDLTRTYYDYITNEGGTGRIPNIVFLELCEIMNLKTVEESGKLILNNNEYRKIGVQSNPGLRMVINKEEIYVGRTGVYELKNQNVKIGSFGVVSPAQTWKNKTINIDNINLDLANFQEDKYFVINADNEKEVNNADNGIYNYYRHVDNSRCFPSFTIDYVYELIDKSK